MLKKSIFAGLCLTILSLAVQAGDGIKIDLLVSKGDAVILKAELVTINGVAVPISKMTTVHYWSKIERAVDGTFTITPGEVTNGVRATVVPVIKQDGRIQLQVSVAYSELLGMGRIRTLDGSDVQIPNQALHFDIANNVVVDQGKLLELYGNEEGYRVGIVANAI